MIKNDATCHMWICLYSVLLKRHTKGMPTLSQPAATQTWLSQLWALLSALHFSGEQISSGPALL